MTKRLTEANIMKAKSKRERWKKNYMTKDKMRIDTQLAD